VLWPAGGYYPEPASVTVNAPKGTVGMHEGMEVVGSDGHSLGSIEGWEVDPDSDEVTTLHVRHGFLTHTHVHIPADQIAEVEGDRVQLKLTKDEAEARFEQRT
jgi:uncharacterized protein YrrD